MRHLFVISAPSDGDRLPVSCLLSSLQLRDPLIARLSLYPHTSSLVRPPFLSFVASTTLMDQQTLQESPVTLQGRGVRPGAHTPAYPQTRSPSLQLRKGDTRADNYNS